MRALAVAVTLIIGAGGAVGAGTARAQSIPVVTPGSAVTPVSVGGAVAGAPPSSEEARLPARQRNARVERNLGWALAGLGIASAATGAIVLLYSLEANIPNEIPSFRAASDDETTGIALVAAGVAMLIPGLVLSTLGQNALTNLEWRKRALVPTVFLSPTREGAVLGASVRF